MANVSIYYGPAGCGKTYRAVNDFYKASKKNDPLFPERNCFLVVPEQLTVETERKYFELGSEGLIDSEVISFARLVHRIVKESDIKTGLALTGTMRSMLLVKVLSSIEDSLVYFKEISEHPSGVSRLSTTLSELEKYSVTPEILENASLKVKKDSEENDITARRLHELSIILKAFNEETENCVSGTALALKAIEIISSGISIINGSCLFFDSFSGFTEVELNLIKAMASVASEVSFYVFSEAKNPVFSIPNATLSALTALFPGCRKIPLNADDPSKTRFANSPMLYYLSRAYGKSSSSSGFIDDDSVKIVAAVDFYHEILACADEISRLCCDESFGYTYSDIAVALPSVQQNYYILDAVFREKGIPCFIDARNEFSGHRLIRFTDAFLKILADDRTVSNIMVLLKTGLFGNYSADAGEEAFRNDVDLLENSLIAYACDKKQSFRSFARFIECTEKRVKDGNNPGFLLLAKKIQSVFCGKDGYLERAKLCKTVNDVLNLTAEFVAECGIPSLRTNEKVLHGGTSEERDNVRVRNAFIDILNECSSALGEVRRRGYKVLISFIDEVLMSASASIRAASIPYSGDYVQVGDLERSGYVDKKVMMVLGANGGNFPGNLPDSSFLGDDEREAIKNADGKTAYNSVDRAFLSQFNVYRVLTCPRERLYVSYSMTNGGSEELQPASAVGTLKKIFRNIKTEIYAPADSVTPFAATVIGDGPIVDKDNVAKTLKASKTLKISATSLDAYKTCGYSFFLEKCLGLTERDSGNPGIDISGDYVHYLLEKSVSEALEKGILDSLDEKTWNELVNNADKEFREDPEKFAKARNLENSEKGSILSEITRSSVAKDLVNLSKLTKKEGSKPLFFELRIGNIPGSGPVLDPYELNTGDVNVQLTGKVDRGDYKAGSGKTDIMILDYKASDHSTDDVVSLKKIQLPVYALALATDRAKDTISQLTDGISAPEVSEIRYYVYGDQTERKDSKNNELRHVMRSIDKDTLDSLIKPGPDGTDPPVVTEIKERVGSIMSGSFPKAQVENSFNPCRYCSFKSVCKDYNREDY